MQVAQNKVQGRFAKDADQLQSYQLKKEDIFSLNLIKKW
jgi:hypothetical protein